ncbi:MAG: ATP-dependent helicase/nuclease subunit B [Candidatus Tokpelaia sp. JSC161]|jgi:ATP-dependent helicase/nuclease subunit B|nr:MAG: ATP-dependent helicase/nuclease subunit B [Candidatus Tokpelaia sp. JSC161]
MPLVFSIPPGTPFLLTFVQELLQGNLITECNIGDPRALAETTIYVPTTHAANALRNTFIEFSSRTTLLPTIYPLDNEQNIFLLPAKIKNVSDQLPIKKIERVLLLTRLIRAWQIKLPHEISIAEKTSHAIWFARELSHLIEKIEIEDENLNLLKNINSDHMTELWQVTLNFLNILIEEWPKILKERQLVNPVFLHKKAIEQHAAYLSAHPPRGAVLIAGFINTNPAITKLIKTISLLQQGAIIIPGVDRDLDEISWDALNLKKKNLSAISHPQYNIKKLLEEIGIQRTSIKHIGFVSSEKRQREQLISLALRPASTTNIWIKVKKIINHNKKAFQKVSLIEAQGEREEARAIAIALRFAIEKKQKAALMTSNRNFSRRVSAELKRFGIKANSWSQKLLLESDTIRLIRFLINSIFEESPIPVLSLLKNPLVRLETRHAKLRENVEQFELALRGSTGKISLGRTSDFIIKRLKEFQNIQKLQAKDILILSNKITQAAAPLYKFAVSKKNTSIAEAIKKTIQSLENFGRDKNGSLKHLYRGESGKSFKLFVRSLITERSGLEFTSQEWPKIFEALIAEETFQEKNNTYSHITICKALEARLQSFDTIILSNLNEVSDTEAIHNNPFLSRAMQKIIHSDQTEKDIGLAAHDFQMALGMNNVILSRSLRTNNSPSLPSRLLQRVETLLGSDAMTAIRHRGNIYLQWGETLDTMPTVPYLARPCPKPPITSRPTHFSISEIEVLRHDPYAIYAKKILRLKPLDPLLSIQTHSKRGTLYHEIIAAFSASGIKAEATEASFLLRKTAKEKFNNLQLPPYIQALWWPHFLKIAEEFLKWEISLGQRIRFSEISADPIQLNQTGTTISGRADRIDLIDPSHCEIIDFKTGSTPSSQEAAKLLSPQLALEGALLLRGAFSRCGAKLPSDILYIRLTKKGTLKRESLLKETSKTAIELSEEAWQRLEILVKYYQNPENGYLSYALAPRKNYRGDYDHLARLWEWSVE